MGSQPWIVEKLRQIKYAPPTINAGAANHCHRRCLICMYGGDARLRPLVACEGARLAGQMVQSHARREELSPEEKKARIQQVQGLSQEQARQVVNPEKTYPITLSEEECELLRQLKHRLATSRIRVIFKEALKRTPDRTGEPVKDSKTKKSTASLSRALYQDPECAVPECTETRHLQKDHKMEWSEGGKTTLENMQLICRPHNQMKSFKKIRPYLKQ
jgi:5-methylcytosine-specific restriction endonuclease McrA